MYVRWDLNIDCCIRWFEPELLLYYIRILSNTQTLLSYNSYLNFEVIILYSNN